MVVCTNWGPSPRTLTNLPSPLLRSMATPLIRCSASARFCSGNAPMSSAVIASTKWSACRLRSSDCSRLVRMPRTMTTSTSSSSSAASSSASSWASVLPANSMAAPAMMPQIARCGLFFGDMLSFPFLSLTSHGWIPDASGRACGAGKSPKYNPRILHDFRASVPRRRGGNSHGQIRNPLNRKDNRRGDACRRPAFDPKRTLGAGSQPTPRPTVRPRTTRCR